LKKLGLEGKEVRKGMYIDGHKKPEMVFYHLECFLLQWKELEKRMLK